MHNTAELDEMSTQMAQSQDRGKVRPLVVFQPGNNANPKGGLRNLGDIREMMRRDVPAARAALLKALKVKGERVRAAELILQYAYGKPQQTMNVRVIRAIDELSEEELQAIAGDGPPLLEGTAEESEPEAEA